MSLGRKILIFLASSQNSILALPMLIGKINLLTPVNNVLFAIAQRMLAKIFRKHGIIACECFPANMSLKSVSEMPKVSARLWTSHVLHKSKLWNTALSVVRSDVRHSGYLSHPTVSRCQCHLTLRYLGCLPTAHWCQCWPAAQWWPRNYLEFYLSWNPVALYCLTLTLE